MRRNALHFFPATAGVACLVNAAAGRRDDVITISWINVDGKDIRIINYAVLDAVPGLPAVSRLVGQIPGAGINNVGGCRIKSQGFDMDQPRGAVRWQLIPGGA